MKDGVCKFDFQPVNVGLVQKLLSKPSGLDILDGKLCLGLNFTRVFRLFCICMVLMKSFCWKQCNVVTLLLTVCSVSAKATNGGSQ